MPRYVYHLNCCLFGVLSAIVTKHLAEEKKNGQNCCTFSVYFTELNESIVQNI